MDMAPAWKGMAQAELCRWAALEGSAATLRRLIGRIDAVTLFTKPGLTFLREARMASTSSSAPGAT